MDFVNKPRESGIDIARLLFMFMVVILHTLAGFGNLNNLDLNSALGASLWFLEILCYCAVDGFGIISGYVSYGKSHNIAKLINTWFQVIFYTFTLEIFFSLINNTFDYSLFELVKMCLPITMNKYWYFSCYAGLFILMPVIDSFIDKHSSESLLKYLIFTIFIFTIVGLPYDPFNSNHGYSLIWLIILYIIGAITKKTNLFHKSNTFLLLFILIVNTLIAWFLHVKINYNLFTNYNSPFILINALLIVICLSRIKKTNKYISNIAICAFGVYLVHWKVMSLIAPLFTFNIFEYSSCVTLLILVLYAVVVFVISLLIDYIRLILFNILNISSLSLEIERLINFILNFVYRIIE